MRKPGHDACAALVKAIDAYIEKADTDLAAELRAAGYPNVDELMEGINGIEKAVAAALAVSNRRLVESVSKAVDLEVWRRDVFPNLEMTDELAEIIARAVVKEFSRYMPMAIETFSTQIDAAVPIKQMSAVSTSFIQSWAPELGELMKLDTYDKLEKLLTDGMQSGNSIPNVARQIRDAGIRDTTWKARRVALTEMLRASSVAQQDAMMQSPSCARKRWRHSGGRKITPRPNHVAMDGQEVPKDQPFDLEGRDGETYHPMYPREYGTLPAFESINCHCIMQMVPDENVFALSPEERRRLAEEAREHVEATRREWEAEAQRKAEEVSRQWHLEHDEGPGAEHLKKRLAELEAQGDTGEPDGNPPDRFMVIQNLFDAPPGRRKRQ